MRYPFYGANNPYTVVALLKALDGESSAIVPPLQLEALNARIRDLEE